MFAEQMYKCAIASLVFPRYIFFSNYKLQLIRNSTLATPLHNADNRARPLTCDPVRYIRILLIYGLSRSHLYNFSFYVYTFDMKTAIVTGGTSGIGAGITRRLAQDGYFVLATYLQDEILAKQTKASISAAGGQCEIVKLNVSDPHSVVQFSDAFGSKHTTLDILVNNAGADIPKSIEDATFEEWTEVLRIKSDGPFLMIKNFLPFLKTSDNANIINITSHEGELPNPAYLAYGVATAALIAITKGLACSLPKYGIRVNAVSPGTVRTPLWKKTGEDSEALWKDLASKNPMGRVPAVEDISEAVMTLVNDKYKYLNGVFLYVNGGNHLKP